MVCCARGNAVQYFEDEVWFGSFRFVFILKKDGFIARMRVDITRASEPHIARMTHDVSA